MLQEEMPVDCVPEKFTDEENLSDAECGESQVVFEEETLSYGRVIDNLKTK